MVARREQKFRYRKGVNMTFQEAADALTKIIVGEKVVVRPKRKARRTRRTKRTTRK